MDPREVMTRRSARPDAVVRYGAHGQHGEQVLDVHLPATVTANAGPAPVTMLVHGGFWRQAYDRTHARPLANALAAEGWAVVVPEYRRVGGDGGWPQTGDDVADAFAHLPLLDAVVPGGLSLDQVTLVGHSAGGHLAMWLGLRAGRPTAPRVRRVVALAPVADLYDAHARGLGGGAVEALMGGAPEDLPEQYAAADAASLLRLGRDHEVPVTVVHGDRDEQVPVAMSRALPRVDHVELAGADHFALIDPLSPAWPHVLAALGPSGQDG